jgi:hypothetical protein
MKLSNRVLWILILLWFVLSIYGFYKYFFELKLTNIEINSNISNFSWSLVNVKFSKDFFCKNKKCIIEEIPPFEYNLSIKKENYKTYNKKIVLWEIKKINIFLEKDIRIEPLKIKKINNTKKIDDIKKFNNAKKINNTEKNITKYSKIYNDKNYVFHHYKSYLSFKNINNSSIVEITFKPKINYIKKILNNNFLIVSEFGSYNFNIINKKLEYFSLFWDYIKQDNNYIWIINSDDKIRRKNFW